MAFIWDYNRKDLAKTEAGRIKILERTINYGPEPGEKVKLADVRKYWDKMQLFPRAKRLFELLLWGTYLISPKSKPLF